MALLASSEGLAWGSMVAEALHLNDLAVKLDINPVDAFNGLVVFSFILICSILYRLSLKSIEEELVPDSRVSLKNIFQTGVECLVNLVRGVIPHHADDYLPVLGTAFIFIFLSNLLGIFPGFAPPTHNLFNNLGLGLTIYFYYNIVGVMRVGFKNYMAHFLGPVWWMAPLLLVIEIISHAIRPLSLSLRLFGNINGDHIVLGAFTGIYPLFLPIPFLAFGIFVSFIQAFVFTLLSSMYVAMAVETHEHGDHGHGHDHDPAQDHHHVHGPAIEAAH